MKGATLAAVTALAFLTTATVSTSAFALDDAHAAHLLSQCFIADDAQDAVANPALEGWSGCCSVSLGYCVECPANPAEACVRLPISRLTFDGPGATLLNQHLSVDDVRHLFEHRLARNGNERLKVGEIREVNSDTIVADIVTDDDSLVERFTSRVARFTVDRHTGMLRPMREAMHPMTGMQPE